MEHAVPGDIVGHLRYPGFGTERYWMYAAATEIERLRTVLKPFAEAAKRYTPYPRDMETKPVELTFTLGELRQAASAVEQAVRNNKRETP